MPLPDLDPAFRALLVNAATSAGSRVSTQFPANAGSVRRITFERVGGLPMTGYHQGENARLRVTCWGEDEEGAWTLWREMRDALLPPATPNEGYYGNVSGVRFSGIAMNAGPEFGIDPPTGLPFVESYWLVPYLSAP